MNRFRRKSTSGSSPSPKKKSSRSASPTKASERQVDSDGGDGPSGAQAAVAAPSLVPPLPDTDAFRTSLILPHLTQRFSLLKDGNGNSVRLDALQEHIENHRKAGSLTDVEADAVLAQLGAQSGPSSRPSKPNRTDWRQLDKDFAAFEADNATAWASTSTSKAQSIEEARTPVLPGAYLASPFIGGSNKSAASSIATQSPDVASSSSASFHSPMLSSSGWSVAPSSPYKRSGGNSMFGGRVQTLSEAKLGRSSASINSSVSRRSTTSRRSAASKNRDGSSSVEGSPQLDKQEYDTPEIDIREADSTNGPAGRPSMSPLARSDLQHDLSERHLRRISRALDDIEQELALEYHRDQGPHAQAIDTTEDMAQHEMANQMNDTELMDPVISRLPQSGSMPSINPSPDLTGALPPTPESSRRIRKSALPLTPPSQNWSPSPTKGVYDVELVRDSVLSRSSFASPPRPAPPPPTSGQSPTAPLFRTPSQTNGQHADLQYNSLVSPVSQSSAAESALNEPDPSTSDYDGPFDLSFDSAQSRARGVSQVARETTEAHNTTGGERPVSPLSTGSSYHPDQAEEGDPGDDVAQARASLAGLQISGVQISELIFGDTSTVMEEEDDQMADGTVQQGLLSVGSEPMSRRPSDELLKAINGARTSGGEADLALDDLMRIQEGLVRSASKRAAKQREQASAGGELESAQVSRSDDAARQSSAFRLSRNTATTLATEASPTAYTATPSNRSDAFEFSSLAASPAAESFQEARDQLMLSRDDAERDVANNLDSEATVNSEETAQTPHAAAVFDKVVADDAPDEHDTRKVQEDEIVQEIPARVGRGPLPPRNPAATQTMLVREVRNQATMATFALRKNDPKAPASQRSKSVKRAKSVSKAAIGAPRLVSGTSDIPAVPIVNPEIQAPAAAITSHRRNQSESDEAAKSKGLGTRFRKLLKKQQSRDRLPELNGDEVTPFDVSAEGKTTESPPFTPPNQTSSKFETSADTPEQLDTPQAQIAAPGSAVLSASEEFSDRGSPATNSVSSRQSKEHGLSRFVSRIRRGSSRRESETTLGAKDGSQQEHVDSPDPNVESLADDLDTPERIDKGSAPGSRRPSLDGQRTGLGFGIDTEHGRMPISYDISAAHRRFGSNERQTDDGVGTTAPLQTGRLSSNGDASQLKARASLAGNGFAPESRHRPTGSNVSANSMQKLRDAAEELGLSPEKADELVNLSYATSPTSDRGFDVGVRGSVRQSDLPLGTTRLAAEFDGADNRASVVSPGHDSYRSSYYANSVLDLYASEGSESGEARSKIDEEGEVVLAGRGLPQGSPAVESDRSGAVWSVVDDLRRDSRHSSMRSDGGLEFDSRPSSLQSAGPTADIDPLTQLLRHHKRNRSSISSSIPSIPSTNTRFPSLYLRDEQRLLELGQIGGIAEGDKGRFYVRPVVRDSVGGDSPEEPRVSTGHEWTDAEPNERGQPDVREEEGYAV